MKPVLVDLCSGRFGWSRAFASEGWECVCFDITAPVACDVPDGCHLIVKSILDVNGYDLRHSIRPALVVASPPCQEFTRWLLPWTRRKNPPAPDLSLVNACYRIARQCGAPIVLENVRAAQWFIGSAQAHWGSQYLWGDVPALLPVHGGVRKKESRASKHVALRSEIPFDLAQFMARTFKPG